jgi:glycosyltransferase involved in cell wall biosynthesis
MKVLIIRNAFKHDFGGAERLTVSMAECLQSQNIQTLVMSSQPRLLAYADSRGIQNKKGLWWSKQNWSGVNLFLLPVYLIWQMILCLWYLAKVKSSGADIVHIVSRDDFIAATVAARLLRKPVFWTDCADLKYIYLNHRVWYKNPTGKLVFWAGRFAHAIFLVSNSEKNLVQISLGRDLPANYTVAYLGVKEQQVTALVRDKKDANAIVFCATSRLVVSKGIGELVAAFNKISTNSKHCKLWIVGDGPDQDRYLQEAASNPNIIFHGHSDTPLAYVAACDIFVHPSYHEGFSLSLLEAAMLGKPIIACDVGGNPELVDDENGLLVPAKNSDALAEAMAKLSTDRAARLAKGEAGRKKYCDNFELGHIIKEQVIPLYEQALKD